MSDEKPTFNEFNFRMMLQSPYGVKFIGELLKLAGVLRIPYVPGEPELTAFNSGGMNIGQIIIAEVAKTSPQTLALIIQELTQDARPDANTSPRSNTSSDGNSNSNPGPEHGLGFSRYGTDLGQTD